jgi:hypothetical protein
VKVPKTPGTYFICAKADADVVVSEGNESNNMMCTDTHIAVFDPTPVPPTIETVKTSSIIGGPCNMPYEINAEDENFLYIASGGLLQVEKNTGNVKTLTGYTRNNDGTYIGAINLTLHGPYLYAADNLFGKIYGVFTGEDEYSAIELLHSCHLPENLNSSETFSNSTYLFYYGYTSLNSLTYQNLDSPSHIQTPPGSNRLVVTENEIFFGNRIYPNSKIFKYDLTSKQMDLIKEGIQVYPGDNSPPRMTWHNPYLYWADGTSIDRYDTITHQTERVATNVADYIENLAVNDNTIYVYENYGYPPKMVKVDILFGQATKIWDSLQTRNIIVENGQAFFLEGGTNNSVYTIVGNKSPEKFLSGADVGLPAIHRLASKNGVLFLGYNSYVYDWIATYDLSSGQVNNFRLVYSADSLFYKDEWLYAYTYYGSGALTRIPVHKSLRPVIEISPKRASLGAAVSMVRDDNKFYWIWRGNSSQDYRISKVSIDNPGPAEDLFQSSSELRDIAIHNGKLYFSCLDNCGTQGWALASLPLEGGTVKPVLGLGGDPRTFFLNGVCYVVDTLNFYTANIYAINLNDATYSELLSGLSYHPDDSFTLKASLTWLYVGHTHYTNNGPPGAKISRHQIIDWKTIRAEEIIAHTGGFNVDFTLMTSSISTDGKHLYYWDGALKRVAE